MSSGGHHRPPPYSKEGSPSPGFSSEPVGVGLSNSYSDERGNTILLPLGSKDRENVKGVESLESATEEQEPRREMSRGLPPSTPRSSTSPQAYPPEPQARRSRVIKGKTGAPLPSTSRSFSRGGSLSSHPDRNRTDGFLTSVLSESNSVSAFGGDVFYEDRKLSRSTLLSDISRPNSRSVSVIASEYQTSLRCPKLRPRGPVEEPPPEEATAQREGSGEQREFSWDKYQEVRRSHYPVAPAAESKNSASQPLVGSSGGELEGKPTPPHRPPLVRRGVDMPYSARPDCERPLTHPGSFPQGSGGGSAAGRPLNSSEPTNSGSTYSRPRSRQPLVVATMARSGSIYQEVARQLAAEHHWSHVHVTQRAEDRENSGLFCSEKSAYVSQMNLHVLLGEKIPTERLTKARREAVRAALGARRTGGGRRRAGGCVVPPLPMGGDDGERRVVNYVESMRSITLKCSMIKTLLKHHQMNWKVLGSYMPQTFFIASKACGAKEDDRVLLMQMARHAERSKEELPLWIVKSSAGCHGKNIRIFQGDSAGVQSMCHFVDRERCAGKNLLWVAQRYVDRPLLFHRRKFDIRCLALLRVDDFSIYVHRELVMRLSSVEYSRDTALLHHPSDIFAHITNHCVQAEAEEYASFEEENELWREHLDGLVRFKGKKLMKRREKEEMRRKREEARSGGRSEQPAASTIPLWNYETEPTLANTIIPQMHFIIKDTIFAGRDGIPSDPKPVPTHTFQLFGYDFIVDEDLHVWLLEINGSPGIASRLVRQVASDIIDVAILPHFPPKKKKKSKSRGSSMKKKKGSPSKKRASPGSSGSREPAKRKNGFEKIYPIELSTSTSDDASEEESSESLI